MAIWQLCKNIFGFWADGDTYETIGTRHVKLIQHIITYLQKELDVQLQEIFSGQQRLITMEIRQAFMLHFIN